ncbi:MAG: hypothetical protein H7067_13180 [Burkholderiales bacterium]|nr:hypothetical protein [Opitutaceae bacterium]
MTPENTGLEEITEARRKAIAASLRPIGVEELKTLGEELFPFDDHPWRAAFFGFINENAGATFHHATTHDHIQIIYCPEKEKGIWFLPNVGKGPIQPKGLAVLKEIVEGR